MVTQDPIADFLTQIRNAVMAGKSAVSIPHSSMKERVAKFLEGKGYLSDVEVGGKKIKKRLSFGIVADENGQAKVKGLVRISKPSKRIYLGYKEVRPVKFGYGMTILSTPKGIMSDEDAKREKTGGEALFKIW